MSFGDVQYIADTEIIEKVIRLRAPLERQAGVLDFIGDSLGSVAGQIQQYVLNDIDTSSVWGLAISVLKLMEPVLLFKRHWLLGLLDGVAQAMGFSLTGIFASLISSIRGTLMGGQQVSPEQINQAGASLIASQGVDTGSADDIDAFAALRELDARGQLFKFAANPLDIFNTLGRYKTYALLVRMAGWFLKTILLSAGLLVGGGMIAKTLGLAKPKEVAPSSKENQPTQPEKIMPGAGMAQLPASVPSRLQSSGRGEEYHVNDAHSSWIVPIYGSVRDTVLAWAVEIYPELSGYEDIIESLPSFNRTVNILSSNLDYRTPNYLVMPKGTTRRIDVVNTFANDAAARLPKEPPEKVLK